MTRQEERYEAKATAHKELTKLQREFKTLMGQANAQHLHGDPKEALRLSRQAKALLPRISRLYRASM